MQTRITAEVVAAFRAGDSSLVDHLLGLRPWQQGPFHTFDDDGIEPDPTPPTPQTGWDASLPFAKAMRLELDRIVAEEDAGNADEKN